MKFVRVQTNRAKLKEVISSFSVNLSDGESLVAPRPLPKERFKYYIAFAIVNENMKNDLLLKSIKNYKTLSEEDYHNEVKKIPYSWSVGNKSV